MPTARLRAARRITRDFCRRHGLAYREMSWLEAAREATRHFKAMSACGGAMKAVALVLIALALQGCSVRQSR